MKRFISFLLLLLLVLAALPCAAAASAGKTYFYDYAETVDDREREDIETSLDEASAKYGMDIVLVAIPYQLATPKDGFVNDIVAKEYAENWYDENGFSDNGVLLVCFIGGSPEAGKDYWYIYARGDGTEIYENGDELFDRMFEGQVSGDYANIFSAYAENALDMASVHYEYQFGTWLAISLGVGLVIALIATMVMKGKLKSVKYASDAAVYTRPGSMVLRVESDRYLYSTVTRTARPKNNSDSSSSDDGGSSSSGGGRSF